MDDKLISKAMALAGSKGGRASSARLSVEERSERGKKAVAERWKRYRAAKQVEIAIGENTKGRVLPEAEQAKSERV